MSTIFTPPRYSPMSGNGTSYPAAKLYFYTTGTSTPKNTYSDAALVTPNANPVVADANGLFGSIYLASGDYKAILQDADSNVIWTVDPQPGLGAGDTLTTRGDLLTRDASGYSRLAIGAATYVLTSDGVDASWAAPIIPRGSIQGLTYANNVADATNDIDIAVGNAMDDTNARFMVLAAALTKRSDAAWAVGTNQGGLDDIGSAGNNDFYIWEIQRSDTAVVDALFSLSSTAPTLPTNYNFKRLIGWFKRAGGTVVAFKTYETAGGGLEMKWNAPTLDIDLSAAPTTSRRTDAVKVPLNFSTVAIVRICITDASAGFNVIVCCPDETDAAPSPSAAPLFNFALTGTSGASWDEIRVRTSAAGLIAARSTLATIDTYKAATVGFEWSRR